MRLTTLIIIVAIIGGGLWYANKEGWFAKAQESSKNSPSVHMAEGSNLYQQMKYDEAIKEFEAAYSLEPTNPESGPISLMRLAECYKEKRDNAKAAEYYERCIKEFPQAKVRGQVEQSLEKVKSIGYH